MATSLFTCPVFGGQCCTQPLECPRYGCQGGAWTSPSKVQTSRGNLHLSESDWGEFLLKFDLGPQVASLVMSTPLFVLTRCSCVEEGGAQVFGMVFQGPLPRGQLICAPCSNKGKDRRSRSKAKDKHKAKTSTSKDKGTRSNQGQGKAR